MEHFHQKSKNVLFRTEQNLEILNISDKKKTIKKIHLNSHNQPIKQKKNNV